MFTSNDTPANEFVKARELNAIINLDDISHIPFLEKNGGIPDIISVRYNPGKLEGRQLHHGQPGERQVRVHQGAGSQRARGVASRRALADSGCTPSLPPMS